MTHLMLSSFPLVAIMLMAGCSEDSESTLLSKRIGSTCTVQFRRDALGSGAQIPVPPFTDTINGAQVSASGTLAKVDSQGILLRMDAQAKELWIPYHALLLVDFKN